MKKNETPDTEVITLHLWLYFSPSPEHQHELDYTMQDIEQLLVASDARPLVIKRDPPYDRWICYEVQADYTTTEQACDAKDEIISCLRSRIHDDCKQTPVLKHILVDVCPRDADWKPELVASTEHTTGQSTCPEMP